MLPPFLMIQETNTARRRREPSIGTCPRLIPLRLLAACLFVTLPLGAMEAAEEASWRAGAASTVITPKELMWLAGYDARQERAHGIAQELYAKALALEDAEGNRLVIVTMDLIGVTRAMRDAIEERAAELYGLRPAALLLNASHTHCGPEFRSGRTSPEEESRAYLEFWEMRVIELIGDALEDLAPVHLLYGQGAAGFAMNRRGAPGGKRGPYWKGAVDHNVPVLQAIGNDGRPRAILFGYACHPTTIFWVARDEGANRYEINGDYPGYAQEELEKNYPGAVALFMNGCGGDQNPHPRGEEVPGLAPLDLAKRHGMTLASAVTAGMTAAPRVRVRPALASIFEDVEIVRTGDGGGPFSYPVQVVRLGSELVLVALASEVVVDYSLRLKRELAQEEEGAASIWVAGYSNGYFGYIPSERVLQEGGYEAGPWKPGLEDRIVGAVHRMHRQLEE